MKKQSLMLAFALAVLFAAGCATKHPASDQPIDPHAPQPALKTGKRITPPQGCVELRKRNGAC